MVAAFQAIGTDSHYPLEYRTAAGQALVKDMQREAAAADQPDPFLNVPEKIRRGLTVESQEVADSALGDGQLADEAIAVLRRVKDLPFFLGLGFLRPHLPLCGTEEILRPLRP